MAHIVTQICDSYHQKDWWIKVPPAKIHHRVSRYSRNFKLVSTKTTKARILSFWLWAYIRFYSRFRDEGYHRWFRQYGGDARDKRWFIGFKVIQTRVPESKFLVPLTETRGQPRYIALVFPSSVCKQDVTKSIGLVFPPYGGQWFHSTWQGFSMVIDVAAMEAGQFKDLFPESHEIRSVIPEFLDFFARKYSAARPWSNGSCGWPWSSIITIRRVSCVVWSASHAVVLYAFLLVRDVESNSLLGVSGSLIWRIHLRPVGSSFQNRNSLFLSWLNFRRMIKVGNDCHPTDSLF